MKGLTLTQPWAELVAIEAKRIETRSWRRTYRGPIAIHAAQGLAGLACHSTTRVDQEECLEDLCNTEPFAEALYDHHGQFFRTGMLARGAIVAVATLVEILPSEVMHDALNFGAFEATDLEAAVDLTDARRDAVRELAFGDYTAGRWAWVLDDVRALPDPIPCRGGLSLWDVPADVEATLNLAGATR